MSTIEQLADRYGLFLCVECGKCVAVCPMAVMFDEFSYAISPRGIIESVLLGEGDEALGGDCFWFCLTCDLCTSLCPAGVRFRDFMEASRSLALESGANRYGQFCRHCGRYLGPTHTVDYLKRVLGEDSEGVLTLCPRCRRYDFGEKAKAHFPGSRKLSPREARGP